ncbi:MAG: NUDIX hydrolase [Chloroflexi bacterium]|nr:NUDIX hydrolase [Chloroflexota bacterium]
MNDKQTVFRTEWFTVERETFDDVESLKGKPYYRINSSDSVAILATTEKEEIILVRQFRPALNQYTLEFPAGAIDESESPEAAAARELYEETGFVCKELNRLGKGRIMMSRYSSHAYAFYGTGAVKHAGFQEERDCEVVLVTRSEFKALVLSEQFEQFPSFALLVLADWKFGSRLLG